MSYISNLPQGTLSPTDKFIIENGDGLSKSIPASDIPNIVKDTWVNAAMHNNIYRGKYLGTEFTQTQLTAITSGTFDDLYLGDYWNFSDKEFMIADFDYFYGVGSPSLSQHHIVLVSKELIGDSPFNETRTTQTGYANSYLKTTYLSTVGLLPSELLDHAITHKIYVTDGYNTSTNRYSIGWHDAYIDIMNEIMLYGCYISTKTFDLNPVANSMFRQLSVFNVCPTAIKNKVTNNSVVPLGTYWLNGIASGSTISVLSGTGVAADTYADSESGVRVFVTVG